MGVGGLRGGGEEGARQVSVSHDRCQSDNVAETYSTTKSLDTTSRSLE